MIDIHDLPPEEAKLIEEFVEFLRNRQREEKRKEPLNFATWPLGVKGKLTRKEIYDYL